MIKQITVEPASSIDIIESQPHLLSTHHTDDFETPLPTPTHTTRLYHYYTICRTHAWHHSILISIIIQLMTLLIFVFTDPDCIRYTTTHITPFMSFILITAFIIQLTTTAAATHTMMVELTSLQVQPVNICYMYITTCILYAQLYYTCFIFNTADFILDGYATIDQPDMPTLFDTTGLTDTADVNDVASVYLYFVYFSGAIMTSTGFGDIVPRVWYTQLMVNTQQLIGTMYHTAVFGITVQHFRTYQKMQVDDVQAQQQQQSQHQTAVSNVDVRPLTLLSDRMPWLKPVVPYMRQINQLCVDYVLLFNLLIQIGAVSLLSFVPSPFTTIPTTDPSYHTKMVLITVVILIQFALFLHLIYVSIKLVRDVNTATVSFSFLLQSFISTALLYAGLYLTLYSATPSHQFYRADPFSTASVAEVVFVFIHFSITVLTSTGFGDVYARGVIGRLFVLSEMWVCILYTCVIIGLGSATIIDTQTSDSVHELDEQIDAIVHVNTHTHTDSIVSTASSDAHMKQLLYNSTPTPVVHYSSSSGGASGDSNEDDEVECVDIDAFCGDRTLFSLTEFVGHDDADSDEETDADVDTDVLT